VGTSTKVSLAIHNFADAYQDVPNSIANLQSEHRMVQSAVEQFEQFAQAHCGHGEPENAIKETARQVIEDTDRTLEELFVHIDKMSRAMAAGGSKRRMAMIRLKYMWNERGLNAILLRLQARRDAITCLSTLWGK
jgi:hypothetical protein